MAIDHVNEKQRNELPVTVLYKHFNHSILMIIWNQNSIFLELQDDNFF